MTKQTINVGTTANDKKGDSLRAAFTKVNNNFDELYTALGLANDVTLSLGAFEFTGSTMTTTDSTAIVIDQSVTVSSDLTVGGDIVPQTANGGDLGSSTLPWRSLYVSNNTIYIGGTAVGIDANGALTTGGTVVGSTPAWNSITGKPTFASVATSGLASDLSGTINTDILRTAPFRIDSTSYIDISTGGTGGSIDINALSGDLTLLSSDDVIIRSNMSIWTLDTDGRTIFPNGTVPEHSYGAAGDKEGMVVFTDPYIYYCKQDYVNNSTDIWVRVAWTGTSW